ncbi:lysylphosphatidylglycerol synthase domain-containing protein [Nonomuraea typhae]|uniref:lysylphosphatidylglycerol synthase domain-containing protein n=1 Tax=Nonomuraea typhae TaxID=2603600 RepID=UPI001CA5ECA1|nr:lysylphosphatidylglycerol synthase domain-containing protein [Nonomuraea typhae]
MTTSRRRWVRVLDRVLVAVFVAALGVGLMIMWRDQDWSSVGRLAARLGAGEIVLTFGAAFLINSAGLLLGLVSWRALFTDLGAPVDGWTASRLFFVGFLTKFVPGRFVALPVLVRMGRAIDVGPLRLASVFLLSWAIVALTGLTIGLAAGPAVAGLGTGWLLAASLPTFALLVRPSLLNLCLRTAARVLRRPAPPVSASDAGLRKAILTQSLSWVVSGHHLWLLAVAAGAPPWRAYLVCIAGFAVATTAGILVMVAPDGIGVREAVLVAGLATVMPLPLAGTVVLASRVVSALSGALVGAAGLALAQHMHRRRHKESAPGDAGSVAATPG